MKKILMITALGLGLVFYSCKSDQENIDKDNAIKDSVQKAEESGHTSIGVFTPPDSNYTGDYFEKYETGVIRVRGTFRFGKKSGKWMYFYPDGILWSEAYFSNNKMHGESNVFHTNGQKMYAGHYNMDMADSVWTFYDTLGKVVEVKDYRKLKNDKK